MDTTGLPRMITLTSSETSEALADPLSQIVSMVKAVLEKTPPELSADILDRGIALSGGGALLRGLDERLRRETSLPVIVAEDPLTAVVRGTGKVLESIHRYQKVLSKVRRY